MCCFIQCLIFKFVCAHVNLLVGVMLKTSTKSFVHSFVTRVTIYMASQQLFPCAAKLFSDPPNKSNIGLDAVSKSPQGRQNLELSCDQLVQGETLEETIYLCASGEGVTKLRVNVSKVTLSSGVVYMFQSVF